MSDLPPLDQPQAHVVVGPNDQRGPYALELLISEVIAGRLSDETPVWWPGLPDWTTMGSHPGVAAELQRRRAPAAAPAPAPGWADPTQPVPAPAEPQPAYAAPTGTTTADPFSPPSEDDIEDAVVVEDAIVVTDTVVVEDGQVVAEAVSVSTIEPHHAEAYSGLVARSAARAQVRERVDAVDESIVTTVIDAASDRGFELTERNDVERGGHELRFDSAKGDLLVISLGRVSATNVEDIRDEHLPLTVSYRSGAYEGGADAGTGEHGEVRIVSDEWTGQATSTVSLFLGVGDYFSESLELDRDALALDIAATIATVQHRLS